MARELAKGYLRTEPAKAKLLQTRKEVERGWEAVSHSLFDDGHPELAAQVRQFVDHMPPPRTENEWLAVDPLPRTRDSRVHNRLAR